MTLRALTLWRPWPDAPGGSHEAMSRLNRAVDAALREVCGA